MSTGRVIDAGSIPRVRDYSNRGGIVEYTDDRHERWTGVDDVWLQRRGIRRSPKMRHACAAKQSDPAIT